MNSGLCAACAETKGLVLIRHPSSEPHYCRSCGRYPEDSELNWVTLQHYQKAELDRLDREHRVIDSIDQLRGWEIIELIRWKPNVVRYVAKRHNGMAVEMISGYAKDQVFSRLQLPR